MLTGMSYDDGDDDDDGSNDSSTLIGLLDVPTDDDDDEDDTGLRSLAQITAHLANQKDYLEQELFDAQRQLRIAQRRSDGLRYQLASIRGKIRAGDDDEATAAARGIYHANRPDPPFQYGLHDSNGDLASVILSCSSLEEDSANLCKGDDSRSRPNHAAAASFPESPFHMDAFSLW